MNSVNITCLDAAYDGLKTTLNVMVNITDGLDWPLKAAPQTCLYILKLFEVCRFLYRVDKVSEGGDVGLARCSTQGYCLAILSAKTVGYCTPGIFR